MLNEVEAKMPAFSAGILSLLKDKKTALKNRRFILNHMKQCHKRILLTANTPLKNPEEETRETVALCLPVPPIFILSFNLYFLFLYRDRSGNLFASLSLIGHSDLGTGRYFT